MRSQCPTARREARPAADSSERSRATLVAAGVDCGTVKDAEVDDPKVERRALPEG